MVSVVLDNGLGVVGPDLDASSIQVKDNLGRIIGGIKSHNEIDTIYWTFISTSTIIDNSYPQIISVYPTSNVVKDDTVGINTDTQKNFLSIKDLLGNLVSSTFTLNVISSKTVELVLNIAPTYKWVEGDYYLTIKA